MHIKSGLPNSFKHLESTVNDRIPTRFDDIQREILLDRFRDYYNQKSIVDIATTSSYKLGDVIGDKLNKII